MLTVDTRGGAIALLVIGLILLGTWGALLNLAERKGRSTTHTYIDFCIAFFLVSLVCALTLGQFGHSSTDGKELENFIYQLQHSSEKKPLIGFAMGAGVCIFFGNLGLQLALTLCGVTIAVPLFSSFLVIIGEVSLTILVGVGINSLLANGWGSTVHVVKSLVAFGGTSLNWAEDKGLNAAPILFPGVACFFLAFVAGSITHLLNERHISRQKHLMEQSGEVAPHGTAAQAGAPGPKTGSKEVDDSAHGQSQAFSKGGKDGDSDTDPLDQAEAAGGAARLPGPRHAVANVQHEWADPDAQARSVRLSPAQKRFWGIIVASLAGAVGSLFSPGFNVVTNDTFHTLAPGVQPLTVYTGYFWFCVPFIPLCIVQCSIFMRWPILGQKRTTWMAWLKDHTGITWFWGFLSGVLVSAANVLQFLGGQAAGYAASDLVQANPIIATLWGIFLFHEFHRSTTSKLTYFFLACMYALYIGAVVLLAISAKARN